MASTSFEMLSNSWMAEKSLPKPNPAASLDREEGATPVTDAVAMATLAEREEAWFEEATVAEDVEGVGTGEVAVRGSVLFLRDGGTMAGVSSFGTSFLRTFSAIRYMARANCSAFSLPFFSMSHRFLNTHTHTHVHKT